MKYLLYLSLFFCLLYGSLALTQDENLLDLVKIQQQSRERKQKTPARNNTSQMPKLVSPESHVTITHRPLTPKPFKITLLSLDKQKYRAEETCVYEIRLENITNDPIVIPWSLDSDIRSSDDDTDPPGYLKARVNLIFSNGGLRMSISGISISGSSRVPYSLKTLKPKESVRLRVPGRIIPANIADRDELIATLPGKFEVLAYYDISKPKVNWSPENSLSENALTVELAK